MPRPLKQSKSMLADDLVTLRRILLRVDAATHREEGDKRKLKGALRTVIEVFEREIVSP